MAPAYKLTYFNGRGLGETIRLLFAYGGIEYEDNRIEQEAWPQLKAASPFGQMPFLEHNGKTVNQSNAIARYVAKQVKLVGDNDWENLEIDSAVDTFADLRSKLAPVFREPDEDKKKILKQQVIDEAIPFYFGRFENQIKKNGGFIATTKLTWADVAFACALESLEQFLGIQLSKDYPKSVALKDKVLAIPKIKSWVDKRPATAF